MQDVAVIGLGQMGATLARLLLGKGYRVHVWNRTMGRAEPLVRAGAMLAESAAAAIRASRIVVMCVLDYAAANAILSGEAAQALQGRVLVQLTTGSPEDAREGEAFARANGAGYVDGAIQVAPSQMGLPDTTILVSGAKADFEKAARVLAVFGGNVVHLGESPSAAAAMDLATLSYVYGAILGFFQGALFAQAEGLDLATYGEIVSAMAPSYGAFLKHEAGVIASGDFTVSESPLSISVEATRRIANAAAAAGLDTALPELVARRFEEAQVAGYEREEIAALMKVLRKGRG